MLNGTGNVVRSRDVRTFTGTAAIDEFAENEFPSVDLPPASVNLRDDISQNDGSEGEEPQNNRALPDDPPALDNPDEYEAGDDRPIGSGLFRTGRWSMEYGTRANSYTSSGSVT